VATTVGAMAPIKAPKLAIEPLTVVGPLLDGLSAGAGVPIGGQQVVAAMVTVASVGRPSVQTVVLAPARCPARTP